MVLRYRNLTLFWTLLFISIIHLGVHFLQESSWISTLITWLVSSIGAITIIILAYHQISKLRENLASQLSESEKQSQRQTSLAAISAGFANTLQEEDICHELADRLHEIQGYDYVAVYLLEEGSKDRSLKANIGGLGTPDSIALSSEEGLSALAIEKKELQYTADVSLNPAYIPGIGRGSEIDVPIQFNNQVLGVIVVENAETNAFGPDDFSLLITAADQTALAILNSRLLKAEKKRRYEAEVLRNATMTVSSDLNIDHVLGKILTQLGEVVPFDSACIFLKKGDHLVARAAKGLPRIDEVVGKYFPAEDPLFHKVLTENKPYILSDIQETKNFRGWGGTNQMRAWMGIPLNVGSDVIGILTLDNKSRNAYNQEKSSFALIFANQAAVAIQNAQLYNAAKTSAEQLMILHQASRTVTSSSFDPEKTYQAIHEAAKQLMPCEAFIISILNEKEDTIEGVYLFDRNGRNPPIHIPADQGLSGLIIKTGEPILIQDYLESQRMAKVSVKHFGNPDHIRAFIAVPMRLGKKVVGMLSAQSYQPHGYTKQDQQMLEMLAAHAAIAIDNAHLFAQLQHHAITDSLTGVHNRRFFFDVAEKEFTRSIRYKNPLSIMMVDLDSYKEINDRFGHIVGDKALKIIANLISENIRETDIIGRYGGDEFSILLPETNLKQATELAERLRVLISHTKISIENVTFSTTISTGVSCSNSFTEDFSDLLLCADFALYRAKEKGRNKVQTQQMPLENPDHKTKNIGEFDD